jgi:hypothetical protein
MSHFEKIDFDVDHLTTRWFLTLFAGYLPTEVSIPSFIFFLKKNEKKMKRIEILLNDLYFFSFLFRQRYVLLIYFSFMELKRYFVLRWQS